MANVRCPSCGKIAGTEPVTALAATLIAAPTALR